MKEELQPLIPECLALDVFADRWAFVAVALVQTAGLRPKGFPQWFGSDFFLIGYRVFVRYTDRAGRRLRGLYILKSETNSRKMEFFGNMFTHYQYTTTDIGQTEHDQEFEVRSALSDFQILVRTDTGDVPLPEGSPFADWHEARKFAGPMPYTFAYNPETRKVLIIEGVRKHWAPRHTEASIRRARNACRPFPGTRSISTADVPLPDDSADKIFVTLSAHEIRNRGERIAFFKALKRCVKPAGQVVVTEHLRDLPNFLAYTIGFLHFLSAASWNKTFRQAGLAITATRKTTPFITTFVLEKHGTSA